MDLPREATGDEQTINLVRAFVDPAHARVAVVAGERELLGEAIATVDLERLVYDERLQLGGQHLARAALDRVLLRCASVAVDRAAPGVESGVD